MTVVLILLLLTMALSLASVVAQGDNILRITALSEVRTVDPHVAYETDTWAAVSLFYRDLVTLKDDGEPEPALAESWTISDDGKVYTFKLRSGGKFANGREITADDVKYSFERLLTPATASPTSFMFTDLVGTKDFQDGKAKEVTGLKVVDKQTIEFTFETRNWTMMKRFALPPGVIVAKEGVEAAGAEFARKPAGAGPFVLDSWETGVRVKGSRNPNYWRQGLPNVDGFELTIGVEPSVAVLRMESGEADISFDPVSNADYPRLAADPALSKRLMEWAAFPNTDYVILNTNIKPFDNIEVRRALDMAIDRNRLIQINNNRAVVSNGLIPPTVDGHNKDLQPRPYDPAKAKEMLAKAGYPDGFSTKMLSNTDPQQQSTAQAVIADWGVIGVKVELTSIDNAQFLDVLINQPDQVVTAMTAWYNDYLDPSNNYEPLLKCGGSYNWGRHCNKDIDAVFEKANAIPVGEDRWKAFAELEKLVHDDSPNMYLYHLRTFYFTSERLKIKPNPALLLLFDEATVK
jgi:ABC-type transport system substrate-binding protein